MLTILLIFLIAFLSSLILTPLVWTMGHRLGVMDIPVELSIHVYDLLPKRGLGNRRAVLVIYLTAFLLGIFSLIMIRLHHVAAILLAIGVVMIMCFIAVHLGAVKPPVSRKDVD